MDEAHAETISEKQINQKSRRGLISKISVLETFILGQSERFSSFPLNQS
jgi:hypothetical protein